MIRPVARGIAAFLFLGLTAMPIIPADIAQAASEHQGQDMAQRASGALRWMAQDLRARSLNGGYGGLYLPLSTPGSLETVRIQRPGTPDTGQCLLRAHAVLGDEEFLVAAKEVGRALAWYQSADGGWSLEIETPWPSPPQDDEAMTDIERPVRKDTLDDNTTQGALDFLLDLDNALDEPWLDEALEIGLNFLLESQLEAGGWPQYYPLIGGYHDFYTFNDGVTNQAMGVMLKAYDKTSDPRYIESVLRGALFIASSQLPPPQAGWAQQYDGDLRPAAARPFEPVAVSSSSTSRNILTLLDVAAHTGDAIHLSPIPDAIAWLEESALDEESWARFYELGTNRPIYPSRSGDIHTSIEDLPPGESERYAYIAGFKAKEAIALYRLLTEGDDGRADKFERWRDERSRGEAARKAKKSEKNLPEALAYAEQHRTEPAGSEILLGDFIQMCETVLDYLEFRVGE